nr:adenylate/guanylate cyclase domain-containing protein [Methylobacterium sp. E-016]
MALWNAPLDDAAREANAAAAALDMLARMDALNEARQIKAESGGYPVLPLDVGIGINTGPCVVGNMGSDLRFEYSVLGDSVNLASRLEGQSKYYGVKIILGAQTAQSIRARYAVLEIDLIQVKGKTQPERISTLVGDQDCAASPRFAALSAHHEIMVEAYRARRWDEAHAKAEECRTLRAGLRIDGVYRLYLERIRDFRLEPPPPEWTGIYVALSK